jgi:alpha-2-macroglobulin
VFRQIMNGYYTIISGSDESLNEDGLLMIGKKEHLTLYLLCLMILFSAAACTPQATATPTDVPIETPPTEAPIIQPQPAVTGSLQPYLLEVQPPPGSDLGLDSSLTLYFNQAMDAGSVEAAFSLAPSVAGSFEWPDTATVRFIPGSPLPPTTLFQVLVSDEAVSVDGQKLGSPSEFSYQSADYVRVMEMLPAPGAVDVNAGSAIMVTFNQPMVENLADGAAGSAAFTLEPAVTGRGEWVNPGAYIFYPSLTLAGSEQYTVRLNPELTSLMGAALAPNFLAQDQSWQFLTAKPALISYEPIDEEALLVDSSISLHFNQSMDTTSVEENFSFLDTKGEAVSASFSWNEDLTTLVFTPDEHLTRGTEYNLILLGSASGVGGIPIDDNLTLQFNTLEELQAGVIKDIPEPIDDDGRGLITIGFNNTLAEQDLFSLVLFDPQVEDLEVVLGENRTILYLSGIFDPNTNYTLGISPDVVDAWGGDLGRVFVLDFKTALPWPVIQLPFHNSGESTLFFPAEDVVVPTEIINIETLNLSSSGLDIGQFIELDGIASAQRLTFGLDGLSYWTQSIRQTGRTRDQSLAVEVPLFAPGSAAPPGLYYFLVDSPEMAGVPDYLPEPFLGVVSDVQIVAKRSSDQIMVWAVNLALNAPVANTPVVLYDENGGVIGGATTNGQGLCQIELGALSNVDAPIYITTWQPGNPNFGMAVTRWSQGLEGETFGIEMIPDANYLASYLYTDRTLYHPGDTVNFRLIARQAANGRYELPAVSELNLDISWRADESADPVDLASIPLTLSAYGAASGAYQLPEELQSGFYYLQIENSPNSARVEVIAENQSEVRLSTNFSEKDWLMGEDITAEVEAEYHYGAPAAGLTVSWSLLAERVEAVSPKAGFQVGKANLDFNHQPADDAARVVLTGEDVTAEDGTLNILMEGELLADKFDTEESYQLSLLISPVSDGRSASATKATATVRPAAFLVAIRTEDWGMAAGEETGFTIQSLDWDGKSAGGQALEAHFYQATWRYEEQINPATGRPNLVTDLNQVGATTFETSDTGDARLVFSPTDPGAYLLEVSNQNVVTQALVWISGENSAPWPDLLNQRVPLATDAAVYLPGQTARIFIPNPFDGEVHALITIERGTVMRQQVLSFGGSSIEYALLLSDVDAPNVNVSVVIIGQQQDDLPDFRVGYITLPVEPVNQILNVELEVEPEDRQAGEETTFTLRARDAAGRPVRSEFSLAIVDPTSNNLLAADSIMQAFYGVQPNGVASSLSLAAYARRGAIYSMDALDAITSDDLGSLINDEDWLETAYWYGSIETDINGLAEFSLVLPDEAATWRVDVRGITQDSLVGQAMIELDGSRDLVVNVKAPASLVMGDRFEPQVQLSNRSAESIEVDVTISASGFSLDAGQDVRKTIVISGGGQERVSWPGVVENVSKTEITFQFESEGGGNIQPETVSIPVSGQPALQPWLGSGVLSQAGEATWPILLPLSFEPGSAQISLELYPSLPAFMLDALKTMDVYPPDRTEAVISNSLAVIEVYRAFQDQGIDTSGLQARMDYHLQSGVNYLGATQNIDGGWGWVPGADSDSLIAAYAIMGLYKSSQMGIQVDSAVIQKAQDYLNSVLNSPGNTVQTWKLDRLVFIHYALQETGRGSQDLAALYEQRDRMSIWAQALLAMAFELNAPGSGEARSLIEGISSQAIQASEGVHWPVGESAPQNLASAEYSTAAAAIALARLDPTSELLPESLRYLISRQNQGVYSHIGGQWASSFETAWALRAFSESLRYTGGWQSSYSLVASIGEAAAVPRLKVDEQSFLESLTYYQEIELDPQTEGSMTVRRDDGVGSLYYRMVMQAMPAPKTITALPRGMFIDRRYYEMGDNCRQGCTPINSLSLKANTMPVEVRLTLILPQDRYYVVVEDRAPAGFFLVDGSSFGQSLSAENDVGSPMDAGWRQWYFSSPKLTDQSVRWISEYLPAGVYELVYYIMPQQVGAYTALPAHIYQYYQPEVAGSSASSEISIME